MRLKVYLLTVSILLLFSTSCGTYSFSGASIPDGMKTVSIQIFENNAPLVVPYLSNTFTEALKERIRNQSSLSIVRTEAHGNFEGRITDYSIRPTAVQGNQQAGLNRLTITVNVKYTNTLKPEQGFEQPFSQFKDFSLSAGSIQSQEAGLIADITKKLTEDIFNRAFANW